MCSASTQRIVCCSNRRRLALQTQADGSTSPHEIGTDHADDGQDLHRRPTRTVDDRFFAFLNHRRSDFRDFQTIHFQVGHSVLGSLLASVDTTARITVKDVAVVFLLVYGMASISTLILFSKDLCNCRKVHRLGLDNKFSQASKLTCKVQIESVPSRKLKIAVVFQWFSPPTFCRQPNFWSCKPMSNLGVPHHPRPA